jgi:hypothetical protein
LTGGPGIFDADDRPQPASDALLKERQRKERERIPSLIMTFFQTIFRFNRLKKTIEGKFTEPARPNEKA